MADWEVALERQMDTWLFYGSDSGRAYLDGYRKDVAAKYPGEAHRLLDVRAWIMDTLWEAEPIYVSRDMCALVREAMKSFEPEAITEEDVFLPVGFAYLADPLVLPDVWGKDMVHRAIGWHTGTSRGDIPLESASGRLPSAYMREGDRGVHVMSFAGAEDKDDYWNAMTPAQQASYRSWTGTALTLGHAQPLVFGKRPEDMDLPTLDDTMDQPPPTREQVIEANQTFWRFIQVMWRLMGQRIAVGHRVPVSRPTRRRIDRHEFRDKYVTVITLRRPRHTGEVEQRTVDWSHRWLVGGHWRWQPYGDGTHRQIWISPYVKGPEDKPLLMRGARVFRWVH